VKSKDVVVQDLVKTNFFCAKIEVQSISTLFSEG